MREGKTFQRSYAQQRHWSLHVQRLSFLLEHCCPRLRWALVRAQEYRSLNALLLYRDRAVFNVSASWKTHKNPFKVFVEHLTAHQLLRARQFYESMRNAGKGDAYELLQFLALIDQAIQNAEERERQAREQKEQLQALSFPDPISSDAL